jgi:putative hydrolases of HD superfamily
MIPEGSIEKAQQQMTMSRLESQLAFLIEIDKLKNVIRRSMLCDGSRRENSAEHSWHLATFAAVLAEYAPEAINLTRVLKMLLVHDIVEVDAGDTFAYDFANRTTQHERELRAADRLFGLLPADQASELRALWEEFEQQSTPESKFANALDRLQPLLQNLYSGGQSWREHGVTAEQVLERMRPIETGASELWPFVLDTIERAVERGLLKRSRAEILVTTDDIAR